MKRHSEAESRYLEQDQMRRDIEYANTIFHYVWYIQSRQRNSNIVKQQTLSPLPLPDSDYALPPSKRTNNLLNRNSYPGLKTSKRLRQSQTNKPVRNKTQVRPTSPPYITNSSPDSLVPPLLSGPRGFHTPDFSDTLCTAEDFPFPVSNHATYPCELSDAMRPDLSGIPLFVSCLQEYKPNHSRDEATAYGSMVKWNNLNM